MWELWPWTCLHHFSTYSLAFVCIEQSVSVIPRSYLQIWAWLLCVLMYGRNLRTWFLITEWSRASDPKWFREEGEWFLLSMAFLILSYHFSTQILLQFCTSESTWKNGLFYLKQKKCKVILPICLWIPFDKSSFGIAQNGYFFPLRGKHNCMENLLILTMLSWFSSGIVYCVLCIFMPVVVIYCCRLDSACVTEMWKKRKKYIDSSGSAFVGPLYIWKTNGLLNLEHSPNLLWRSFQPFSLLDRFYDKKILIIVLLKCCQFLLRSGDYTVSLLVGIEGDCDKRKFAGTTLNTFGEDYWITEIMLKTCRIVLWSKIPDPAIIN